MQVNLRFGMHRDVEMIHDQKDRLDGIVVPAHILAHQAAATSVFVTSLPNKAYIIDPMTYLFQNRKNAHLNDKGELRPSVQKLCDEYHEDLSDTLRTMHDDDVLTPDKWPDLKSLCQNVVDFQMHKVERAAEQSGTSKYRKRYSQSRPTPPRAIIPPYVRFDCHGDEWYKLNQQCAEHCQALVGDLPVYPVICLPIEQFDENGLRAIAQDWQNYAGVIVWIDGFQQDQREARDICAARLLIRELYRHTNHVETLYGGFLLMLAEEDGMSAVSQGILYTQHKSTQLSVGSGGPPERYYIPDFFDFRSLAQTDLILHRHPELICSCEVCDTHLGNNPDNIVKFNRNPDLLRKHFLTMRRREADAIKARSRHEHLEELKRIYNTYHDSIRSLQNPDAVVSTTNMQGLQYLKEWIDGFSQSIS